MTRRWIGAVVVGLALVAAWVLWQRRSEFRLPARIRLEDVVADLTTTLDPGSVVAEPPGDPVRLGGLRPGHDLELNGGWRRAILTSPPSRLRFRIPLPSGSRLRFGIGVDGGEAPKRDAGVAGVRFAVEVDGREIFARTLAPTRTRHDRRWIDADVALPAADGERDIVLRTERIGPGDRAPRAAGWNHVRVVRDSWHDRQPASAAAPNVLILLVDTFRTDPLGCYGARPSMTPTLDRLAEDGLVFEEMVSQSSWTMPSVATLLTGLHPQSHGVLGRTADDGGGGPDPDFLADVLPTLPELAQRTGITTIGVSANPIISRATNFTQGFETFVETGWDPGRHNWMGAAEINASFVRWLEANRRHRFLAYLHYMEPHDPYTPSGDGRPPPPAGIRPAIAAGEIQPVSRKLRRGGGEPLPPNELAYVRMLYGLEIRDWDGALAGLLEALDAAGVRDSTILVVVGDHGEEFQEHGLLKHGVHLYDELLHVPLVVAGPGIPRGRVRAQVQGVDLFPTLCAVLGVVPPPGLPGQNVLAPGMEPRPAFSSTRYGIARDGRPTELVSIRAGGWKLIRGPALGLSELYDLAHDPAERRDLYGKAPEGERLATLLDAWRERAPPPPPVGGRDPKLREKLRALGYVD